MSNMKINIRKYLPIVFLVMVGASCQKMDRPKLGDYPKDVNAGGALKFYTAFDGTTPDKLMNAVDSVKANFPLSNPLTEVAGISGKAVQGAPAKDKAINYASANEFAKSTSWTISYWLKNAPATDGEPEFHFSLVSKNSGSESALFLLVEKGGPDPGNSTANLMAAKLTIEDHWVEFVGANRLPNVLNGSWHHLVFVYDETTSKVTAYVDGVAYNPTSTTATVMKGGSPRGAKPFTGATNFVVAGWNKHAGLGGNTDAWVHSYSGTMDQFRLYSKALSASEVLALFNSKL